MTETPARVRTDVRYGGTTASPAGVDVRTIQRLGLALTAGTLTWAASIFAFGTMNEGVPERVGDLTGLAFQLGVFSLLAIQFRTRATGLSQGSLVLLKVEAVILGIASVWSLLHGVLPTPHQDAAWLVPMDICWPLSMLGMAVIAVKIAFTGRWRGVLRWWPLIAESWAVVTVPSMIIFGDQTARWIGGAHLLVGYATLGVLLAFRPHLAIPKD
ncbi:hypothetical protein E0H73_17665 [Kribbella pittospori]|uniref:Uncharacterized protein n=1 Tax=Kribbella pittospori TaxID=722689 RepID=A0A4R0KK82_9ACTN|nr:hypothetical protein [Kribbella pittospori]TCC61081.1 hypothetical protein E0H73_17665 [Kribbella pittospori]